MSNRSLLRPTSSNRTEAVEVFSGRESMEGSAHEPVFRSGLWALHRTVCQVSAPFIFYRSNTTEQHFVPFIEGSINSFFSFMCKAFLNCKFCFQLFDLKTYKPCSATNFFSVKTLTLSFLLSISLCSNILYVHVQPGPKPFCLGGCNQSAGVTFKLTVISNSPAGFSVVEFFSWTPMTHHYLSGIVRGSCCTSRWIIQAQISTPLWLQPSTRHVNWNIDGVIRKHTNQNPTAAHLGFMALQRLVDLLLCWNRNALGSVKCLVSVCFGLTLISFHNSGV